MASDSIHEIFVSHSRKLVVSSNEIDLSKRYPIDIFFLLGTGV